MGTKQGKAQKAKANCRWAKLAQLGAKAARVARGAIAQMSIGYSPGGGSPLTKCTHWSAFYWWYLWRLCKGMGGEGYDLCYARRDVWVMWPWWWWTKTNTPPLCEGIRTEGTDGEGSIVFLGLKRNAVYSLDEGTTIIFLRPNPPCLSLLFLEQNSAVHAQNSSSASKSVEAIYR